MISCSYNPQKNDICRYLDIVTKTSQLKPEVPGTSFKGLLKVLMYRNFGDQLKNLQFNDKFVFWKQKSLYFISIFYWRSKYSKVFQSLPRDIYRTQLWSVFGTKSWNIIGTSTECRRNKLFQLKFQTHRNYIYMLVNT